VLVLIRIGWALGLGAALASLVIAAGPAGLRLPLASVFAATAVDTGENYYAPANLTIHAGDTVTWTNSGSEVHTVTADDNSWGTEDLEPGQSYSFTFATPGTYSYSCILHDGQTGIITVQ
jgi:plastocyanin